MLSKIESLEGLSDALDLADGNELNPLKILSVIGCSNSTLGDLDAVLLTLGLAAESAISSCDLRCLSSAFTISLSACILGSGLESLESPGLLRRFNNMGPWLLVAVTLPNILLDLHGLIGIGIGTLLEEGSVFARLYGLTWFCKAPKTWY